MDRKSIGVFLGLLRILIDIFNLAEQLGVYLVTKQDDIDEANQQRFFFIMFAIGGASSFEGCCCHPVMKVIFGLLIEVAEYICYMTLLPRSSNLVIVATVFFALEIVMHLINTVFVLKDGFESLSVIGIDICLTPFRLLIYGILYEIQLLCVFLDKSSPFRGDLFEIILLVNLFFGIITAQKLIGIPLRMYSAEKSGDKDSLTEDAVYIVWQLVLFVLNLILTVVMMIIGVIYTSQGLRNSSELKSYDYVVYIVLTVWYATGLASIALPLLFCIPLCFCGVCVVSLEKLKRSVK